MDLIQQLSAAAAESGITELAVNSGEACQITLDSGPEITFELSKDGTELFLYAPVVSRFPDDRTDLYEKVLAMNFFGRGTGGGSIGYDDSRDELLLIMQRDEGDGLIDFQALTADFAAVLEHCMQVASNSVEEKRETNTASAMMNMRV